MFKLTLYCLTVTGTWGRGQTIIILNHEIDCSTKVFPKRFVPQSIFIRSVVLINN